jgi:uncharacterized protein
MNSLISWGVGHPRLTCGLIAGVTLLLAFQIPRLQIDTSSDGFMVDHDPARAYYERFKERFGSDVVTIVLIRADDVFTHAVLERVQRLSDAFERFDDVSRVESLTTVNNIKGEGDLLSTEPLVGMPVPTERAVLERIRADALGNRVFAGNIVAVDARATAIFVYTDAGATDKAFNQRFTAHVDALIRDELAPGIEIHQIGAPLVDLTLGRDMLRDMVTFVPVALAVLFVFLFLCFRTLQGMLIPTITGAVSILWVCGLMAVLGLPVNLLTAIVPSLLIVIGCTEDVHMISEYYHLLGQGHDKATALSRMVRQAALPVVITTGTTVVGFGSLVTSNIAVQTQFGWTSSLGLLANFVVTMVVLPAFLAMWPVPRRLQKQVSGATHHPSAIARLMGWLGAFDLRHRVAIGVVAGLLLGASILCWLNLQVNTDGLALFPESSVIRQRFDDVHRSLTGFGAFYVVVETGQEDGVKDPEVLRRIAALQEFLSHQPEVDKTVSVADYVRKMHREMKGGDQASETVPDSREEVAQYFLILGERELTRHVDFSGSTASVLVRHHMTSSRQYASLLGRLDSYLREHSIPTLPTRYTGEALLLNGAADYLAINELTSLSWTFVIIALIHAVFFRSVWVGLLSVVPNVIPVLLIYGLMGLLGIPLNLGTAMIATIAIGIAVDDTVHHVVTFKRQLIHHRDKSQAVARTLQIQGPPIVYVSLALAAGFLVFLFSNFVPVVHYGLLSSLVMLIAMLGELLLTPVVMYWASPPAAWEGRRFWSGWWVTSSALPPPASGCGQPPRPPASGASRTPAGPPSPTTPTSRG